MYAAVTCISRFAGNTADVNEYAAGSESECCYPTLGFASSVPIARAASTPSYLRNEFRRHRVTLATLHGRRVKGCSQTALFVVKYRMMLLQRAFSAVLLIFSVLFLLFYHRSD